MGIERPGPSAPPELPHQDANPLPEGEEAPPPGVHTAAVVRWALVASIALVAVGTWVQYAHVSPPSTAATAAYQCPMHPAVTSERPGPCPVCGMDLMRIDRKATTAGRTDVHGLAPIELSPERIQLIGMRTARVAREQLSPELRTVGYVAADEGGIAVVSARFSGWIERLLVAQSGTYVKKGEKLAAIYSPDLISAQQAFLNAVRWEERDSTPGKGTSIIERDARTRLQLAGMLDEDIDELARKRQVLRVLFARSPIEGYVGKKTAVTGIYVQPGAELFEIANLSSVWVIADVYPSELDRVEVGRAAAIALPGGSGPPFGGEVSFIYPAVSTGSRTVQVRVSVKNATLRLRPGMFVDVTLGVRPVEGLVVPTEAVVDTGELQYAFVSSPGGQIEPRRLRLGVRNRGKVQVLEGLTEGEMVVTTATFLVDSESRLRAAIAGLSAGRASPPKESGHSLEEGEHERREAPAHEAGEHGAGATSDEPTAPRPGSGGGT